jgi:hypothetical protein
VEYRRLLWLSVIADFAIMRTLLGFAQTGKGVGRFGRR